ncbi:MAG: hypothetical protein ABID38_00440 [Candidatus Diapherotrites archaeon]
MQKKTILIANLAVDFLFFLFAALGLISINPLFIILIGVTVPFWFVPLVKDIFDPEDSGFTAFFFSSIIKVLGVLLLIGGIVGLETAKAIIFAAVILIAVAAGAVYALKHKKATYLLGAVFMVLAVILILIELILPVETMAELKFNLDFYIVIGFVVSIWMTLIELKKINSVTSAQTS